MSGPSYIAYFAEVLPGERAQMICDVVVEGELILSYPSGSPAPAETVRRYERRVSLGES